MYFYDYLNQFEEKPTIKIEPAGDNRWRASTTFKGKPLVVFDEDIVRATENVCERYVKSFTAFCRESYDEFEKAVWDIDNPDK